MDRLEKLGLARRQRSESDRRVIYVYTTPEYARMRSQVAMDVQECFTQTLNTLSPEDRQLVALALEKLELAMARIDRQEPDK